MRAEDTIMSAEKLRELWYLQDGEDETQLAMAEAQAEISFKAGLKEGRQRLIKKGLLTEAQWMLKTTNALKNNPDATIANLFRYARDEGHKEGIKEVVGWMRANFSNFMPKHNNTATMGKHWQRFQSQLEKWEIK